jgi:hypothetical protein
MQDYSEMISYMTERAYQSLASKARNPGAAGQEATSAGTRDAAAGNPGPLAAKESSAPDMHRPALVDEFWYQRAHFQARANCRNQRFTRPQRAAPALQLTPRLHLLRYIFAVQWADRRCPPAHDV